MNPITHITSFGKQKNNLRSKSLFFQPKLTINQPDDVYEQEADAVADKVMRMPETSPSFFNNKPFFSPTTVNINKISTAKEEPLKKENKEETEEALPEIQAKLSFDGLSTPPDENNASDNGLIQRKCAHCEEEERKMQRKESNSDAAIADVSTENYISSLNGKGRSLTQQERKFFEPRMGYDFSNVQLHTNEEANQSAKSINALAYTHGNNIVLGSAQYQPNTDEGKKLLAHELTHVVQQKNNVSNEITKANTTTIQKQELIPLPPEAPALPEGMPWEIPEFEPEVEPDIEIEPEIEPEVEPEIEPEVEPEIEPEVEPEVEPDVEPDLGPETEQNLNPEPTPDVGPEPIPPLWPQPQPDDPDKEKDKCGSPKMPLTHVSFTPGPQGQAGTVIAQPLTKCPGNTTGSMADWRVYPQQFKCIKKLGLERYWFPVHLLHGMTRRSLLRNLHGPGNDARNIIIAQNSVNRQMNAQVEVQALQRVYDLSQVLWYESKVDSYVPGAEFFTQSITVNYGLMDMSTGTRGPRYGGGTFTSPVPPPNCPVSLGAAAMPIPLLPPAMADVNSTISLCYRMLTGKVYSVKDGGLRIMLKASRPPGCPMDNYFVTLKKKNLLFDDEISTSSVPQNSMITLTWKYLESGDYYLEIWVPSDAGPNCCLTGNISFFMFSAPRPKRSRAPMIA